MAIGDIRKDWCPFTFTPKVNIFMDTWIKEERLLLNPTSTTRLDRFWVASREST